MALRALFLTLAVAAASLAADTTPNARGKLIQQPGKPPAIETPGKQLVYLNGDAPTLSILKDKRLAGVDLEAKGHFTSPNQFEIDSIENRALLVHKGDKLYRVTYYCDVCSIRTYSPGPCPCCQEETRLDLIDPSQDR
jgi:hypothetical protein